MSQPQDNRDYGIERWADGKFPDWEHVDNSHHDFVTDDGTEVEAKGCLLWESRGRGQGRQRGRFRLWSKEHEKLVEAGGMYLFAVYDDLDFDEPLFWTLMPAEAVTAHIGEFYDYSYRQSKGDTTHLGWRHIFPSEVGNHE